MENLENSTASPKRLSLLTQSTADSQANKSGGDAYLYILIVMSFYGVFLGGIMFGYFRSKRREKRRINIFTRLVHEEEQREWGALPKKPSFPFLAAASELRSVQQLSVPGGNHGNPYGHEHEEGALPTSPLACALCTEKSSISSQCSSADTRFTIEEEESDSGTAEEPEEKIQADLRPDKLCVTMHSHKEEKHHLLLMRLHITEAQSAVQPAEVCNNNSPNQLHL